MQQIREFFAAIDRAWMGPKLRLPLFGCGALLLQTDYERMTTDGDIFETSEHTPEICKRLDRLAGRGTDLHSHHGMFLEIVRNGVPFLPHVPLWLATDLKLEWLQVDVLDVVDVVVSKLARFHAEDRSDIDAMARRGLVSHARFVTRFRDAVDDRLGDAREVELPKYVDRFHEVERDILGVEETPIVLPSWI